MGAHRNAHALAQAHVGGRRSLHALENDIDEWVKGWSAHPKPFIWTKAAKLILESLTRLLQRVTDAGHWVTANAVLVPIALAQTRKRLILDFDRGTLATRESSYPAADFEDLIGCSRSFPGSANLLTLAFRAGSADVQVDGFAPAAHPMTRDEALRAFI